MKIRGIAAAIGAATLLLAGCSSSAEGEASTDQEFYDAMRVGDFADYTDDELDDTAKGLCDDMSNLSADDRKMAVLVLRDSVDTEQQAFEVGQAITERWCPEYADAFDY